MADQIVADLQHDMVEAAGSAMQIERVAHTILRPIGLIAPDHDILHPTAKPEHQIGETGIAIMQYAKVELAADAFIGRGEAVHRHDERCDAARGAAVEKLRYRIMEGTIDGADAGEACIGRQAFIARYARRLAYHRHGIG